MWNGLLIGARLLQFAGALVLLGSALFYRYGYLPAAGPEPSTDGRQGMRRILIVSAMVALFGSILWAMGETALISEEASDGTDPAAVWSVLSDTRFGRACLWRIGALLLSLLVAAYMDRRRVLWILQLVLAAFAIATFAWTGHGATTTGWPGMVHLGADILHLWTAAVWLGALVPLAVLVSRAARSATVADAIAAHHGLARFTAIGTLVVTALTASGFVNSWFLIGPAHWRSFASTPYGVALLSKLALFTLMLALAAANRFRLTPGLHAQLETDGRASTLRELKLSVLGETGIALLVLLAVAVLGTLAPPMPAD
jgi:copper resistance protein D